MDESLNKFNFYEALREEKLFVNNIYAMPGIGDINIYVEMNSDGTFNIHHNGIGCLEIMNIVSSSKHDVIAIPLFLIFKNSMEHVNSLIFYNNGTNIAERFEPYGKRAPYNDSIDKYIVDELLSCMKHKYISEDTIMQQSGQRDLRYGLNLEYCKLRAKNLHKDSTELKKLMTKTEILQGKIPRPQYSKITQYSFTRVGGSCNKGESNEEHHDKQNHVHIDNLLSFNDLLKYINITPDYPLGYVYRENTKHINQHKYLYNAKYTVINTKLKTGGNINKATKDMFTLYILPGCPYCKKAISLLRRNNYKFTAYDISNDKAKVIAKLRPVIGSHNTVPIIFYNKRFIGGFDSLTKFLGY